MTFSLRTLVASCVAGMCFCWGSRLDAAVSYAVPGSAYTQNFDSLPNSPENASLGTTANGLGWTDDNPSPAAGQFSIVGWYLYHPIVQAEGGVNGHQRMRIGAGTANTGAFMSYGSSGSTDRALGDLGSNTMADQVGGTGNPDMYIGLRLHNDTGQALTSFTVTYDGEQWRDGGAATPNAQTMTFTYSLNAAAVNDTNAAFTAVSGLNFASPVFVNTGTGAAVDGNNAGRVAGITATVNGIDWQPGTDLWLRWDDVNHVGNDHGLAIDNFSFSAAPVPEPATWMLGGLGLLAWLVLRRRR